VSFQTEQVLWCLGRYSDWYSDCVTSCEQTVGEYHISNGVFQCARRCDCDGECQRTTSLGALLCQGMDRGSPVGAISRYKIMMSWRLESSDGIDSA
jgi:hypothetical protein